MSRIRLTEPAPEVVALPWSQRLVHSRPVLGLVALGDREAVRALLLDAGPRHAAPQDTSVQWLRVLARSRIGREPLYRGDALDGIAAAPDELAAAVRETLQDLPPHEILIVEGAAALALVQTSVSILVHGGRSVTEWPAEVRSLRGEFDLLVSELRPGTVRRLLAALR